MSDKKLLNECVLNFFYKKEQGRCLSNFWECDILIQDGDEVRLYDSGESCFHGEKFVRIGKLCKDEKRQIDLFNYGSKFLKGVCEKNPAFVKKMGRKFILDKDELALWNILSIDVQKQICKYKYDNYEQVRTVLHNNKGKIFIHPALRCSEDKLKTRLWEGKAIVVDGNITVIGGNMLGYLWNSL
jgi:hypothetical protein